jgi:hypothetical protein
MALRGVGVYLYSFFNVAARWRWWSTPRPGRLIPEKGTRYSLYRRLGGPHGRSGQGRKVSPPSGFDPRTVQPLVSGYTDCAVKVFFFHGATSPLVGQGLLVIEASRSHPDTPHSVELLWTSDQPDAETST